MGYVYNGSKPLPPEKKRMTEAEAAPGPGTKLSAIEGATYEKRAKPKKVKEPPVWRVWTEVVDGVQREHGTLKGHRQHRYRKERACEDCRKCFNEYQKTVPSYLKNKGHKKKEEEEDGVPIP